MNENEHLSGPSDASNTTGFGRGPAPAPPRPPAAPPPAPPAPVMPPWWAQPPKRRSWGRRILLGVLVILLVLSVLLNIELLPFLVAGIGRGIDKVVLRKGQSDQTVAVYNVSDVIDDEAVGRFSQFYRAVRDDEDIKAVVIRVDSPGGGVSASDRIYKMARDIRGPLSRPVIVSMGGVAASGGYYISAAGQRIYAEPTTVTGSIGVISVWPVLRGLLDKHGVEVVTIRSSQARGWKAGENFWEVPDERIRGNVRDMLDEIHSRFEQIVRKERGGALKTRQEKITLPDKDGKQVTVTETEPLNGKAYLAEEALKLGLIDEIGYLDDAVDAAAAAAGLQRPNVVQYVRRRSLFEQVGFSSSAPVIDAGTLDRITTPRMMLLWKAE